MHIQRSTFMAGLLGSVSLIGLLANTHPAIANPEGGTVEAGSATIGQADANTLLIQQQSQRAVINWDAFNVGQGETTRFELPNAESVTLNRDLSGSLSEIYGSIDSNGRFFLVNPNGILFGPNSTVDVSGLVATTHDIRTQDFMAGRYEFNIPGKPNASVINQGNISVQDLGFGAFVAPHVRNEGVVVARMGRVELASASGFALDMHGDRLISFLVENPNEHQIYDANGNPISALVENTGEIIADGGVVAMSASAARGVVDSVINTDGIVQANTVEQRGGRIILGGGGSGVVRVSGPVQARGNDRGQQGGRIEITGEAVVAEAGADIDASGQGGGGTILFGGDYLGGNTTNAEIWHLGIALEDEEIPTSRFAFVEDGARMAVDGLDVGDGGKLIVWSDEATLSYGHLSARGGASGGDGGFIETSGEFLDVGGVADASAPQGDAGTWLLDPMNIAIDDMTNGLADINFGEVTFLSDGSTYLATAFRPTDNTSVISAGMIESQLNLGTSVVVTTFGSSGPGMGDIFLRRDINKTGGGDARFVLAAQGSILVSAGVNVRSNSGALTFELFAPQGTIQAGNVGQFRLNGGDLNLTFRNGISLTSPFDMNGIINLNHANAGVGSGRVDLRFDRNRVNYQYSNNHVEYRTSAVNLNDSTSNGQVNMNFQVPVDVRLHNFAFSHNDRHGWSFNNTSSIGVVAGDALDGIPEFIGTENLFLSSGAQPPSGYVPVAEASTDYSERVSDYRVTAPSGQAILDAHLASLRPRAPIEQVVQEVDEAPIYLGPIVPTLTERYQARFSVAEQIRIRYRFQRDFLPASGAYAVLLFDSIVRASSTSEQLSAINEFLRVLSSDIGLSASEFRLFVEGRNANQALEVEFSEIEGESGWTLSPPAETLFHSIGLDSSRVEKYTNTDGREYVFIREGESRTLVDDGINRGTFNYGPTASSPEHLYLDVLPWIIWGTGPDDTSTAENRMRRFLNSPYYAALASASSLFP